MLNISSATPASSKQTKAIIGGAAVLLAIGIAVTVFSGQKAERSTAAENALYEARQKLDKDLTALAETLAPAKAPEAKGAKDKTPAEKAPPAQPQSIAYLKMDVDAKLAESVAKLKSVAGEFDGTRAAHEAKLMLGDLYYNHGDAAKSIPWYQSAAESASSSAEKALAYYGLGYAHENSGQYKEASQAYEKGVNQGDASLKAELMLGLARTYELAEDKAKAKTIYDQIITQYPNTEMSKTAETRKARLG